MRRSVKLKRQMLLFASNIIYTQYCITTESNIPVFDLLVKSIRISLAWESIQIDVSHYWCLLYAIISHHGHSF